MTHEHTHAPAGHSHQLLIRNKLMGAFLEHMHDTELWASHLPRVPMGLFILALFGFALGAASLTSFVPVSPILKFSTLILGVVLLLPAFLAYRFAQRKWKYASNIRKQIFDRLAR